MKCGKEFERQEKSEDEGAGSVERRLKSVWSVNA